MKRRLMISALAALVFSCSVRPPLSTERFTGPFTWAKLATDPYKGKQDDIFFVNPQLGFYVNGAGKIYKTTDGGTTWVKKLDQPGTYFRCIAFVDERRGFAGNIGTDYFPGVTDTTPLYETRDGGETWTAVRSIAGAPVKGLCAIDVVKEPFINAGKLDERVHVYAAGRVGGPAVFVTSHDGGETWQATDLSSIAGMILDIRFLDPKNGIISAASNAAIAESNAVILVTRDGGKSWTSKYRSSRPYEATWKSSFPNRLTGYVTIQSYNPDKAVTQRYVAKTTDGGETWTELPLTDDFKVREFGVGFVDANTGWVGTSTTGFETIDGGMTWKSVDLGKAANKIRILRTPDGFVGYAIGVDVYKLITAPDASPAAPR
jgi:photosystem II stability/assembly factor-like uncharacterized protein